MPPSQDPQDQTPSAEELLQQLEEKNKKIESLEATRKGLLSDLKKRKTVDALIKAAGVNTEEPDFEDKIAETISRIRSASLGDDTSQKPQEDALKPSGTSSPSDAVDEALKAQLSSLQTQINRLEKEKLAEREATERERSLRRQEILKSKVVQELEKADCQRPSHVYRLLEDKFRLLDDNETAVFGSEDDPIGLRDAATKLREDEEYAIYFRSSGTTGSGLPSSRSTVLIGNNPFATGSVNATEAARILQEDPSKARRLMQDARLAGKLDPVIGKALSGV